MSNHLISGEGAVPHFDQDEVGLVPTLSQEGVEVDNVCF